VYRVTKGGIIKEVIQKRAFDRLDIHSLEGNHAENFITNPETLIEIEDIAKKVILSGWPATVEVECRMGKIVMKRRCIFERYDGRTMLVFVKPVGERQQRSKR